MVAEREEGERNRDGGVLLVYTDGDMVTGKGEPNEFWEYGGCCLGNRCIGHTVTYVMSQVLEVLVPTVPV